PPGPVPRPAGGDPGRRRGVDHPELRAQPGPVPGAGPGRGAPAYGPGGPRGRAGRRRRPGPLRRHLRGRGPGQAGLRGRGDLPVPRVIRVRRDAAGAGPRRAGLATGVVFATNGFLLATWVARLPATRDRLGASAAEL